MDRTRLQALDLVTADPRFFDTAEAVAGEEPRWSETDWQDPRGDGKVRGQITESLGNSRWKVLWEDGDTKEARTRDLCLWQKTMGTEHCRLEAAQIAVWDDTQVNSSESESDEEGDFDAGGVELPGIKGKVKWTLARNEPTVCQRAKKGFTGHKTPVFSGDAAQTRSPPSLADVFFDMFSREYMKEWAAHVDTLGRGKYGERWESFTIGVLYRFIGMWVQMVAEPREGGRRAYWRDHKGYECYCPSQWSFSDIMPEYRFDMIYSVFEAVPGEEMDPFKKVRTLIDSFNDHIKTVYDPSYLLTVDESMFTWTGRGMVGRSFVPRKPRDTGLECKTVCDGISKVLLHIDVQEGKWRMVGKKHNEIYGKAAGCTLRLVEHWRGTGRIVIGDSWFGNQKTVAGLLERGLFCILNIKGATTVPAEFIKGKLSGQVRKFGIKTTYQLECNNEKYDVWLAGHQERNPMVLVATCSTLAAGPDRRFKVFYVDDNGVEQAQWNEYDTTQMHYLYRTHFNRIDLHNRVRQEFIHFADVWQTHEWTNRVMGEVWGIITTNTFFICKFHFEVYKDITPLRFTHQLANQLMRNKFIALDTIERPMCEGARHELILMPKRVEGGKSDYRKNGGCRYCSSNTKQHCKQCSRAQGKPFFICNNASKGCFAKHVRGELPVPPKKRPKLK